MASKDSFDDLYFQNRVTHFYDEVDKAFRTVGAERVGMHDIFFRLSRVATPTVEYSEIKRILADIDGPPLSPDDRSGHRRWPLAWGRASARYREIAERAEASGHGTTAGWNYVRASLLAHSGQIFSRPEWPEKQELQRERAECYRRGAPFLGMERHEIAYDGGVLPGYLWTPPGVHRPPVVVLAPGANSVKEELHRWSQAFVARGLATFTFDGPGQGENTTLLSPDLPMRLERYHEVFTAVIDHLEARATDLVDCSRLAIWGQSMGGYLVSRALAFEKRPVAAVNLGGPPTMMQYPHLPADVQEEMREMVGFETMEEVWHYFQEHSDALPFAADVDVPFLIVHGSRDDLISDDLMASLVTAIGPTAELVAYEEGNHGVFNWDFVMTDQMADWLVDKLA